MTINNFIENTKKLFDGIQTKDLRSKIGTRELVVALVFCFSRDRGNFRTIECIRKFIISTVDISISRGSFWERLATKKLKIILEGLVVAMVQSFACQLSITSALLKTLNVSSILLLDSSSSSLPKNAKGEFPAPRNNVAPAAIKLNLCFDVFRGAVNWFKLTPATTHDRKSFPPLKNIIGKLIIFDLGYWDYNLLYEINEIGGYYLSRIKTNANIQILSIINGLPKKFEDMNIFDISLPSKKNKIIEIIGQFSINGKPFFASRVIGFWNPIAKQYHWYVTNLQVTAELIYPLYRLRWQIEIVFKTFKGSLRLSDLSTANPNMIFTLVYSAIFANMIAHPIANILSIENKNGKQKTPSIQRAGIILFHCSSEFIEFILRCCHETKMVLIKKLNLFKNEIYDPNWNKRETTLSTLIRMTNSAQ